MIDTCKLCRKSDELRSSHLIPKGVYRLLLDAPNKNPIMTSHGRSRETSEQITSPILCGECEKRFSQYGEAHVLRNCWREGDGFYLRDQLGTHTEIGAGHDFSVHDLRRVEYIKIEKFVYYALSMVWRMSVCWWRSSTGPFRGGALGRYEEPIREYLIHNSSLPDHVAVLLKVSSEPVPDNIATSPKMAKINGSTRHKFYIPGLLFIVYVGKSMPAATMDASLSSAGLAFLCPFKNDQMAHALHDTFQRATESGKLASRKSAPR